jgi:hypothetical protein
VIFARIGEALKIVCELSLFSLACSAKTWPLLLSLSLAHALTSQSSVVLPVTIKIGRASRYTDCTLNYWALLGKTPCTPLSLPNTPRKQNTQGWASAKSAATTMRALTSLSLVVGLADHGDRQTDRRRSARLFSPEASIYMRCRERCGGVDAWRRSKGTLAIWLGHCRLFSGIAGTVSWAAC